MNDKKRKKRGRPVRVYWKTLFRAGARPATPYTARKSKPSSGAPMINAQRSVIADAATAVGMREEDTASRLIIRITHGRRGTRSYR